MSKLLTYLKYEGLRETARKCFARVRSRNKQSETVFLKCRSLEMCANQNIKLDVVPLTKEFVEDFESVRFFEHISVYDYTEENHGYILLGYLNGKLVAYAAMEYNKKKEIHGLGFFELDSNEAWLGPVYVKRKYRKKGINSEMLKRTMSIAAKRYGIDCFYTCINKENTSSLKSFSHVGFQKKGSTSCLKGKYTIRLNEDISCKFKTYESDR